MTTPAGAPARSAIHSPGPAANSRTRASASGRSENGRSPHWPGCPRATIHATASSKSATSESKSSGPPRRRASSAIALLPRRRRGRAGALGGGERDLARAAAQRHGHGRDRRARDARDAERQLGGVEVERQPEQRRERVARELRRADDRDRPAAVLGRAL